MRTNTARQIFAAFCIALSMMWGVPSWAAPNANDPDLPQAARDAFGASVRSLDLQTKLPTDKAPIREENRITLPDRPFSISTDFARTVLIVALIAIAVIIVFSLRDNLWSASRARRLKQDAPGEAALASVAARVDKAQIEADDLARQGDFAEAMHILLLQSVGELRRRLDVSIAESLTSREILYRIGLEPSERTIFADIIQRVEISYFGGHLPGEDDYLACRRNFETLSAALGHRVAA